MRNHPPIPIVALLLIASCLSACRNDAGNPPAADDSESVPAADAATPDPADGAATSAEAPAEVADSGAPASTEFDPASVPESTAALPPFPFFKEPEGLVSAYDDKDRHENFERENMIAGEKIVSIEGKVFRDRFQLTNPEQRQYSEIEFQRNYSDAIAALGGVEVSRVQYTGPVNDAFGGREEVDKHYQGTCTSDGCENHTYLIRQNGKEYWIQVSTGAIPLHGEVVLVERQAMTSKLAFLDAAAMKKKLDADGRVALYINFDTDKAALRPDATPAINEIAKLLQGDPALKLSIEGHTDSVGTPERNRILSGERAEAVREALLAKGIAGDRLSAQGFGPDKPIADNKDESGRARNRRVELVKM
jgi:outer membrane protein OmpA-like peptidoglycan-associated protein